MNEKERADIAMVRRGLAGSREKAQAMIMAGEVYIGERRINKASEPVKPEETNKTPAPVGENVLSMFVGMESSSTT